MRKKYAELVRNTNIQSLIRKHATRKRNTLDPMELRELLSVRLTLAPHRKNSLQGNRPFLK
jgi:hypothetical protein